MTTYFPFWICVEVKPIPVELASTNSKNGSRKLGYVKMGAETKARLSLSKASAQARNVLLCQSIQRVGNIWKTSYKTSVIISLRPKKFLNSFRLRLYDPHFRVASKRGYSIQHGGAHEQTSTVSVSTFISICLFHWIKDNWISTKFST